MNDSMIALVKKEPGKGLVMERVPVPSPGPEEVKIRIHKTSICGTDLHIYNWDAWSQKTIQTPRVIGHEFVGEIVELGSAVRGFSLGDVVSGEGHIVCGTCRNCRAGNRYLCPNTVGIGVQRDGAFAEYLVIPADNVIVCPPEISEDLCSSFDPLGNAVHTALTYDVVGEDVLITGAGPIGIMAAVICGHIGARKIVITDVNPYRLNLVSEMCRAVPVNVAEQKIEDVMHGLGMREGFDVGLEMSGNGSAFRMMVDTMKNGGKIALLGIHSKPPEIDWDKVVFHGLTIQGIYGRKMFETWYKMIAMLESGLDVDRVLTHRFDVRDFEKGFEVMNTGRSGKVVLDWTKLHEEETE